MGGITGVTQKQGNTEAGPVGRNRHVFTLFLNYSIAQLFIFVKFIKSAVLTGSPIMGLTPTSPAA